ncbi:hypothetical protein VTI74DRAFT_7919 [Chaetomium olivicolor]
MSREEDRVRKMRKAGLRGIKNGESSGMGAGRPTPYPPSRPSCLPICRSNQTPAPNLDQLGHHQAARHHSAVEVSTTNPPGTQPTDGVPLHRCPRPYPIPSSPRNHHPLATAHSLLHSPSATVSASNLAHLLSNPPPPSRPDWRSLSHYLSIIDDLEISSSSSGEENEWIANNMPNFSEALADIGARRRALRAMRVRQWAREREESCGSGSGLHGSQGPSYINRSGDQNGRRHDGEVPVSAVAAEGTVEIDDPRGNAAEGPEEVGPVGGGGGESIMGEATGVVAVTGVVSQEPGTTGNGQVTPAPGEVVEVGVLHLIPEGAKVDKGKKKAEFRLGEGSSD